PTAEVRRVQGPKHCAVLRTQVQVWRPEGVQGVEQDGIALCEHRDIARRVDPADFFGLRSDGHMGVGHTQFL
ncbi:unnamed protein product, partial [Ectocarpus sp. 12 AP-2014]